MATAKSVVIFLTVVIYTAVNSADAWTLFKEVSIRRKYATPYHQEKQSQRYCETIDNNTDIIRRDVFKALVKGVMTTSIAFAFVNPGSGYALEGTASSTTASTILCQTQCVYNGKHPGRTTEKIATTNCTSLHSDSLNRNCRDKLPPPMVREPQLIPSRPIPGLYQRWQDAMLELETTP
ncbi:hypothetical protein IV203_018213 [Nitzschia inconspicua]|uniref:Uncharacterized protein n=1 Tax=Nitzschia inconspicua TaxID=303405 RepID=A0A9K3Q6A6_9STRA|nr:hypothetical protein IV203_018213 [Nitzschia inconspicua]